MGRRSLEEERTKQIVDAFQRCVIRYGLDGATLEKVAEEAGMTRSVIGHYVGGRDRLVDLLYQRVVGYYQKLMEKEDPGSFDSMDIETFLDYAFPPQTAYTDNDRLLIMIFMTAPEQYPTVKGKIMRLIDDLIESTVRYLSIRYPNATSARCNEVAYGIFAISMSNDTIRLLRRDDNRTVAARACAMALILTLDESR